ncbi:MAG: type II toxin-antitoxin system VapB family antitoxin [Actinomycetota bacterium]
MRTTINLDESLVDSAKAALRTRGLSETVNAALAFVARRGSLRRFDIRAFDVSEEDIATARADRLSSEKD